MTWHSFWHSQDGGIAAEPVLLDDHRAKLWQPGSGVACARPNAVVERTQLQLVDGFVYELGIDSFFGASHAMRPNGERHTHSFRIQARFVAESVDESGMLVGFREVTTLLEAQAKRYANRHLNDLDAFAGIQPTGENLATVVFRDLTDTLKSSLPDAPELVAITLWENPTIYVKVGRRQAG
ncbi:MAG: 6-carboxytetrahydropterin synthase [Tepidiformaceae bacterium]